MTKEGLFFISDYRDVTCEPGRDPAYWVLKELDKSDKFKVYSTADKVIDNSCFKNIEFLTLNYKEKIDIQRPVYNYRIYKAYKKVKDEVKIIHHCEKFQVGKGYNLIPVLSDLKDKALIIGPIELGHKVFEDDFLAGSKGFEMGFKKVIHKNKNLSNRVFSFLFKKTIEHADKVIVPDEEVKKELSTYISSSKIEVINYGVDLSMYRKYKYEADENNYNIVYAGSALERKGVKYLLGAVPLIKKHFPEVKLHLRTAGYKVKEYKKVIKELGISENVVFHGRMELNEYLNLLSKSRLLCLPTLSEGYGWTILDAMCLGVPVVTTTECRCNDLFENGDIGPRVKAGDSDALSDAILKLFNDFELCKKFSENGLKKREKFDYAKVIPKYIKLYEKYI
ncbi:MAG: glycosyltransferase family 4 protein [Thermoplasmatales archaeon]|nr:glycosyltransferase family 4 protein [Thermoplasmatales archaeon]